MNEEKKMINMKTLGYGAALLLALSAGSVSAEDNEQLQTRTQDQIRTQANIQTPDSENAQARYRKQKKEQKMVQEKAQMRNEFRHKFKMNKSNSSSGAMARQSMMNQANRGNH